MSGYNAVLARNTDSAPKHPLASATVAFSHYNNLSAQPPIDPSTGSVVPGGAAEQAAQCLANIKAVVESIGHAMDDVVRLTTFVTDIADLDAVDAVLPTFFADYVPTRTNVAVAALPGGVSVQMEALVSNGEGTIPGAPQAGDLVKVARNTTDAPISPLSTQTVAFSHYNNLSAQLPVDPASGQLVAGGAAEQAQQCLANIEAILSSIGHVMDDVVRITIFGLSLEDIDAAKQAYAQAYPDYKPALTTVLAAGLPMGASVQVEAVVSHGDGTPPQPPEDAANIVIEANSTDAAPQGPYSQTVAFSHYNHIAAQLPVDPATGQMMTGGAGEQAAQCLANIKTIVESVDHTMADAVKINIAMTDLADLDAVDSAYATFFPGGVPARRVIGVSELPGGAAVQIDAVFGNAEGTPPTA